MATKTNPFLGQYRDIKSKHPAAVLLFRCGDFYEAYEEDAKVCAKLLGITLTKHNDGYHMAGFPHHALDRYLPVLIRNGKRVAICDQLVDPKTITNNQNQKAMKLSINNKKNETKNVQTAQVINPATTTVAPAIEDADAVEIIDEKPAPKPKAAKPAAAPKAKFSITTYATKRGGTAYLLFGFGYKEAAEKIAEKCSKTVSASWRRGENNEQLFCLSLGTRYGDVAKQLCDALNSGDEKAVKKACAASRDIYEMAVAAGKAEREAKKAEREAAKAKEEKPKTYTAEEVAALMDAIANGGKVPANIRKHIKAAA